MDKKSVDLQTAGIGFITLAIVGWILIALFTKIEQAPIQFIALLVGVFGTFLTILANYQAQIRNEQRDKKAAIYEEITHFFFEIAFAEVLGKTRKTEEETTEFMLNCIPKLVMWGADEVVANFRELRATAFNSTPNDNKGLQIMLLFEKMLLNIRKDLGHSNNKLSSEGFFIGMFVHDIEQYLNHIKQQQNQIVN